MDMTDKEFAREMKLISRSDKSGLKNIYTEYAPLIYSIAFSTLKNKEQAEDITSDFFLRLWNKADTYKQGFSHKAWMTRIVRNMCLDLLRHDSRVDFSIDSQESYDIADESKGIEDAFAENVGFEEALSLLPEAERQVINLRFMSDMTIVEIATALSLPQGTVAWRLRNALQRLKNSVKEGELL